MSSVNRFIELTGKQPVDAPDLWKLWVESRAAALEEKPEVIYVAELEGEEYEYVLEPRLLPVKALKVDGVRYDVIVPNEVQTVGVNIEGVIRNAIGWGRVYGGVYTDETSWDEHSERMADQFVSAVVPVDMQRKLEAVIQLAISKCIDVEYDHLPTSDEHDAAIWAAACAECQGQIAVINPEEYADQFVSFALKLGKMVHDHRDFIENEYDLNLLVQSALMGYR